MMKHSSTTTSVAYKSSSATTMENNIDLDEDMDSLLYSDSDEKEEEDFNRQQLNKEKETQSGENTTDNLKSSNNGNIEDKDPKEKSKDEISELVDENKTEKEKLLETTPPVPLPPPPPTNGIKSVDEKKETVEKIPNEQNPDDDEEASSKITELSDEKLLNDFSADELMSIDGDKKMITPASKIMSDDELLEEISELNKYSRPNLRLVNGFSEPPIVKNIFENFMDDGGDATNAIPTTIKSWATIDVDVKTKNDDQDVVVATKEDNNDEIRKNDDEKEKTVVVDANESGTNNDNDDDELDDTEDLASMIRKVDEEVGATAVSNKEVSPSPPPQEPVKEVLKIVEENIVNESKPTEEKSDEVNEKTSETDVSTTEPVTDVDPEKMELDEDSEKVAETSVVENEKELNVEEKELEEEDKLTETVEDSNDAPAEMETIDLNDSVDSILEPSDKDVLSEDVEKTDEVKETDGDETSANLDIEDEKSLDPLESVATIADESSDAIINENEPTIAEKEDDEEVVKTRKRRTISSSSHEDNEDDVSKKPKLQLEIADEETSCTADDETSRAADDGDEEKIQPDGNDLSNDDVEMVDQSEKSRVTKFDGTEESCDSVSYNSRELQSDSEDVSNQESVKSEATESLVTVMEDIKPKSEMSPPPPPLPINFVKKFKHDIEKMSKKDLEEIVLMKLVEVIVHQSEKSDMRKKLDEQEALINTLRQKVTDLSKLCKDMDMVHSRVMRDLEAKNEGIVVPVRITRAVGLQVTQDRARNIPQPVANRSASVSSDHSNPSTPSTAPPVTRSNSAAGIAAGGSTTAQPKSITPEVKKMRTVSKITPMRPQLSEAQEQQLNKQTMQQKQLLLQQQKQKQIVAAKQLAGLSSTQTSGTQSSQSSTSQLSQRLQQQPGLTVRQSGSQHATRTVLIPPATQQQANQLQKQVILNRKIAIAPKTTHIVVSKHPSGNVTATAKQNETNRPRILPTGGSLPTARSPQVSQTSSAGGNSTPEQPTVKPMKSFIDLTDDETDKPSNKAQQPPALVAIPSGQQKGITAAANTTKNMTYVISNASNKQVVVQGPNSTGSSLQTVSPQNRVTLTQKPSVKAGQYGPTKSSIAVVNIPSANLAQSLSRSTSTAANTTNHPGGGSTADQPPQQQVFRRNVHPAPLPNPVNQVKNSQWKRIPPRPIVRISNTTKGIVISWSLDSTKEEYAEVDRYQIYAYQETDAAPSTDFWRHVGDVRSLLLPMAVTLTQFEEGLRYHFAVRAVDTHGRVGVFSLSKTW